MVVAAAAAAPAVAPFGTWLCWLFLDDEVVLELSLLKFCEVGIFAATSAAARAALAAAEAVSCESNQEFTF